MHRRSIGEDWFILVVFRSTRRNDRTKQLLRFDLSPPVDPIEFSRMTKHQFREPVVQRFHPILSATKRAEFEDIEENFRGEMRK